jgi:hypothetical protein
MSQAYRLCGDVKFPSGIWRHCDALANDSDTGAASGAHIFTLSVITFQRIVTSRLSLLGVSAQIQGVSALTSDFTLYSHLQFGQRRGGGSNSSKCNRLKCHWNHQQLGMPECTKCRDEGAVVQPSSFFL